MELEKLNQEKTYKKNFFIKEIKKEIEEIFIENYNKLGIKELTKSFLIDLEIFEKVISNNINKSFCKFYLIQKDGSLNLGLSFSNNEDCPIKRDNLFDDDVLYVLENDTITPKDFREMKTDFVNGIGAKLPTHPENKKDTLISYKLGEITSYLEDMKNLHHDIYALKFNMFQYSPTNIDQELSAHFIERDKRIAFCVHVLFGKKKHLYGESAGYDLGNLKP
ncbi:hypothetical protein [Flavobacterium hydrophilum]|uniref:Uncharacterized protein n=1 Tax=Flavobacterium hydrophilum TaxID=2211445 RepID=A0A2V4C5D8_9FLAO|nr:hypothetical protein [Flavobacterium hydrophilum]PXY45882.1 hypothetical protein DMB68_01440 [Flavobacterium hydrophilum]